MNTERTRVEIDAGALRHNARVFHRLARGSKLMGVVKSNAYGHGLVECAKIFSKSGVDQFGVDDLDEALELRKAGIKLPIVVLGYTLSARFREAIKNNVSLTISSLDSLRHCLQIANLKHLRIHLKLETGLNRQGVTESELLEHIDMSTFSRMLECCEIEGVYSHFAAAELANQNKYKKFCDEQMNKFDRMYNFIISNLVPSRYKLAPIKHMAGTAATILLPRARYDLVRIGIGMYGLDPTSDPSRPLVSGPRSRGESSGIPEVSPLRPVLSWYAIIAQIKKVKNGECVGYDLTEGLKRDSKLATVPVGYWHGYPRALNGKGEVLVKGKKCKVIGRISMDMMTVDVTDVKNVKAGDVVTLIGKNLSAEEVATKAGTINYELVTRINPLVPRKYI